MPALVLIGQRRGAAVEAAEALKWPYYIVHHKPLTSPVGAHERGRLLFDFTQGVPPEQVFRLKKSIEAVLPEEKTVIPLGEGGVLLAGQLQDVFSDTTYHTLLAQRLTHKSVMKQHARQHNIGCADFLIAGDVIPPDWSYPCVVKTEVGSGSRGLFIAKNEEELSGALKPGCLAERFITGKEFSVESFVSQGQIVFENITDYTEPKWENVLPAAFSVEKKQAIYNLNRQVIQAFDITSGMTHLELFDTEQGLVFGEIAMRPPGGFIMDLMNIAYGFNPWVTYLKSCVNELAFLAPEREQLAGVRMMHPGAGYLLRVSGVEQAKVISNAVRVRITKKAPAEITLRAGVGESTGYVMATGESTDVLKDTLRQMVGRIHWNMKSG